ncbi:MAG: hypothetical protein Q7S56_01070 [Nanoarchaeota archaeon]|nr:hypothetical protein [Nanoarchaeota archaeon]
MKNKKGDVTSDETIKWILVLVVILILLSGLIFFFRGTIFIWIKNLPGYNQPQGDQLVTTFTSDQLRALNCNVFVGQINNEKILKCATPVVAQGQTAPISCDNPFYQGFYLSGSDIYFDDGSILSKDLLIGSIKNSQIDIDNNVFYNSETNSDVIALRETLIYFDGASVLGVNNIVCRNNDIGILRQEVTIKKSEIPSDWRVEQTSGATDVIKYVDGHGFTILVTVNGNNLNVLSLVDPSDNDEVDFIYFEKVKPDDLFVK